MKHGPSHPYHLHGIRVLLFGVLLTALFIIRIDATSLITAAPQPNGVLAYATNVNRTDLLNATNAYRAQNGLAPLSLNGALNTASQNKAQHMIDNNYWAHVAPDGTQPWYFFDQAGYSYQSAGENLAYGFMTSSSIVDAWINSASHRANILGSYTEVGFGYANGASYQNGENTVVVAHYGTPQNAPAPAPAPAPTPAPSATTPSTPSAPPPQATPTPAPTPSPTTEDTVVASPVEETASGSNQESSEGAESQATAIPVAMGTSKSVNVLERLKFANPPLIALVSIAMTVLAAAGFALTHRSLVRHAVANGERFVITHPALDAVAVTAISILILTTTIGRIG